MKTRRSVLKFGAVALAAAATVSSANAESASKIRVLLITGGHSYDTNEFHQVFADMPNVTVKHVVQPQAQESFRPEAARDYDVVVLYDMWSTISEEAKANWVKLLQAGKGLVATHHCLGSYQDWPEYRRIIGGKYQMAKYVEDGVEKPASTYQHDVDFRVRVEDPNHPVTRGVKDFSIHDETYGRFSVNAEVKPLLSTDEPTSGKTIAWTHTYGKARVVYLELGHDRQAYANPSYVRLLRQSIEYVSRSAQP